MTLKYTLSAFLKPQLNLCNFNKIIIRSLSCSKSRPICVSNSILSKPGSTDSVDESSSDNKITIEGLPLHWEKFGNGPHVALCLPGLIGSIKDNYHPVIKKMNLEKFTVIAWDPPGYGKSRPPDRNVAIPEFPLARDARLVGLLMKELGYEKYSLIGWSNGGISGSFLAAGCPEAIHKVVLCNTPIDLTERFKKVMTIMIDLDNWTPQERTAILETYGKAYASKMLKEWNRYLNRESRKQTFSRDYADTLKKIKAPTLMIHSKGDMVVPKEDVLAYGKYIKNFKFHVVPRGGHSHLEFLPEFVAATEEFLLDS